jgi:hypothetical protein
MTAIDYSFRNSGKALSLECRVKDYWEAKQKTYCFSEGVRVPWKFDSELKAFVSVFPVPAGKSTLNAIFSLESPQASQHRGISFRIGPESLDIEVDLVSADDQVNPDLPWSTTSSGKTSIHWETIIPSYRLAVLLVFEPPRRVPPSVERDWSGFLSGGLPSLGKRR